MVSIDALMVLAGVAVVLSVLPLALTLVNLRVYARTRADAAWPDDDPRVFVCVPARDEAENLRPCVRGLLSNPERSLRVLIYDDQSTDGTTEIAASLAAEDDRVRIVETQPLPAGWNGKQHACWRMARAAIDGALGEPAADERDLLLFTDADVRFASDAIRRSVSTMRELDAPMVSTFPRQVTGSLPESLVVPMMFYLLLGYLPMPRMRRTVDPSTSAGCGQFLMVTCAAYGASGGHEAFKGSMHDGIKMPRAVRRAGLRSDLFDGTDLCSVRMYRGLGETWRGFAKNAYEGLGSVGLLVFMTGVHAVAHVGPWVMLAWALLSEPARPGLAAACCVAIALQLAQRVVLSIRLRHSLVGALLHPLGVVLMTAIQWHSYRQHRAGTRAWRGRVASSPA
ncbi:MAG: glycosyltransferase family 2 protein [Planctomycetota bacterium]